MNNKKCLILSPYGAFNMYPNAKEKNEVLLDGLYNKHMSAVLSKFTLC